MSHREARPEFQMKPKKQTRICDGPSGVLPPTTKGFADENDSGCPPLVTLLAPAERKSIVACILIVEMFISADHNRISVRAGLLDVVITFNGITLLAENCKHTPKGPPNPAANKARF
jgi:hypothetical protein